MAIITDPDHVREIYRKHADCGVPVARIGSTSYTNNEALLRACSEFACENGLRRFPLSFFFTGNYQNMRQMERVSATGRPELGFLVSVAMVRELVGCRYSPFTNVDVIFHLDHGQPGLDDAFFYDLLGQFGTIMFDACHNPWEKNLELTREYVKFVNGRVLVEGAVEEVSVEGVWDTKVRLTSPEQAREFLDKTGCDFIVPNIGTESQRETKERLEYHQDLVRAIYRALGRKVMIIHGLSCLSLDQIATLSEDGVAGINIWTRFARAAGEHARNVLCSYRVPESEKDPNRRFDPYDVLYPRAWAAKFVQEVKEFLVSLGSAKLKGAF
jgi:fructose/tagatose bisphosphate aldolase